MDSVWARFSLNELAATGGLNFGWRSATTGMPGFAYRLAPHATDTCYAATHSTTASLRVYRLPDSSAAMSWSGITVPSWTDGPYVALAGNGRQDGNDQHEQGKGKETRRNRPLDEGHHRSM